jgi:sugar lactone lactonase YvrE
VDSAGSVYISDSSRIRKVTRDGRIANAFPARQFSQARGLAIDEQDNLYVAVSGSNRVQKIDPSGNVTTVAGEGTFGFAGDGALATSAWLAAPCGVSVDRAGALYISDTSNNRIRKVSPGGIISTVAGADHYAGDGGPATAALLQYPRGVAVDATGNLYIADTGNYRIRKVSPSGTISTLAGNGMRGTSGDGGPAIAASLNAPGQLAVDGDGNVLFADGWRVRKIGTDGMVKDVATVGTGATGLAMDGSGNLYISDVWNYRVLKVSPNGTTSTYAGTGTPGDKGEGGLATAAQLGYPGALAVDKAGNLYIADYNNFRVYKVGPSGIITTAAGNGTCCYGGDGGPAKAAQVAPEALAVDSGGSLYIGEYARIRKVEADGTIRTIAGGNYTGFGGEGGIATAAQLSGAYGLAVDSAGAVYVADYGNHRVRKLTLNAPTKLEVHSAALPQPNPWRGL